MTTKNSKEAAFSRNKETKNTIRYGAPEDSEIMGSIYLSKKAVGTDIPDTIKVT
ncbi:MAG: hypothetical protein GWP10_12640, partial [Nitrospiraceae bacterium]|nr:hypothetical protein [Nitrospiraceae bacterium]